MAETSGGGVARRGGDATETEEEAVTTETEVAAVTTETEDETVTTETEVTLSLKGSCTLHITHIPISLSS